jgi:hypothetical protein
MDPLVLAIPRRQRPPGGLGSVINTAVRELAFSMRSIPVGTPILILDEESIVYSRAIPARCLAGELFAVKNNTRNRSSWSTDQREKPAC